MQQSETIFPLKENQLPHYLFNQDFQAQCNFFIRKKSQIQTNIILPQTQQFQNIQIYLVLSGQYVLQFNPITKRLVSGFKCDFNIKFWIIRAAPIVNTTLGKIQGIAFQLPGNNQNDAISLFLDEQCKQDKMKSIQIFTSVLQKKFIVQKQFHQKYKAIKRIGRGVTACVYSALCLLDKSQVAIKSFKKQTYFNLQKGKGKSAFLKQFKILTLVKCKYLSKLYGVYESDNSIYIVLELLDRTLYSYLQKFSFPHMVQSRRMLYQLLIGLNYLHKKNIMHRDIKLQNIMIRGSQKQNVEPVIVDFGLAQFTNRSEVVYVRCGTPGYVAPEVINSSRQEISQIKYDKSCDIFSMGVIFHVLLLGRTVFEGDNMKLVIDVNKKCEIDYQFKDYPGLSPQVRDLLAGMLRKQPTQRYTVDQLMNHIFFREQRRHFSAEINQINTQFSGLNKQQVMKEEISN